MGVLEVEDVLEELLLEKLVVLVLVVPVLVPVLVVLVVVVREELELLELTLPWARTRKDCEFNPVPPFPATIWK